MVETRDVLKQLLAAGDIDQREIARRTGLSDATISRQLNGSLRVTDSVLRATIDAVAGRLRAARTAAGLAAEVLTNV